LEGLVERKHHDDNYNTNVIHSNANQHTIGVDDPGDASIGGDNDNDNDDDEHTNNVRDSGADRRSPNANRGTNANDDSRNADQQRKGATHRNANHVDAPTERTVSNSEAPRRRRAPVLERAHVDAASPTNPNVNSRAQHNAADRRYVACAIHGPHRRGPH
jgi:hypothetical protein